MHTVSALTLLLNEENRRSVYDFKHDSGCNAHKHGLLDEDGRLVLADDQKFCWTLFDSLEAHVVLHYACFDEPTKTLCVLCVFLFD